MAYSKTYLESFVETIRSPCMKVPRYAPISVLHPSRARQQQVLTLPKIGTTVIPATCWPTNLNPP